MRSRYALLLLAGLFLFPAFAARAQSRACDSQLTIVTDPPSRVVEAGQPLELVARGGCRGEGAPSVRWEMTILPSKTFTPLQLIPLSPGRWQWMTDVVGHYRIRATRVMGSGSAEMVVFIMGKGLPAAKVRFRPQANRKAPLDESKPLRVAWVDSVPGPRFIVPWSKAKGSQAVSLPLGRYDVHATRVGGTKARARVTIRRKGDIKLRPSGAELSVDLGWAPKGLEIQAELRESDGRIVRRVVAADGRLWFSSVAAGRASLTLKAGEVQKKLTIKVPPAGRVERVISAARFLAGERRLEPGSWRRLPGVSQTHSEAGAAPTAAGPMGLVRGRLAMAGAAGTWWLQGKRWRHQGVGGMFWNVAPAALAVADGESWAWVGGKFGFRTPVTYRNKRGLSQELLRFAYPCQATGIAPVGKERLVVVGLCRERPGLPTRGFIAERSSRGWRLSRAPRALRGVHALGGRVIAWGAGGLVMERAKNGWGVSGVKRGDGSPVSADFVAALVVFDGLWLSDGRRVGFRGHGKALQWFDLKKKGRPTKVKQLAAAAEGEIFVLLDRPPTSAGCETKKHSVVLRLNRDGKAVSVDERHAITCNCDPLHSTCRSKGRKPVSAIASDGDALWGFTDRPSVL